MVISAAVATLIFAYSATAGQYTPQVQQVQGGSKSAPVKISDQAKLPQKDTTQTRGTVHINQDGLGQALKNKK